MINALDRIIKAKAKYNKETGEGANELLLALLDYQEKSRMVDKALDKIAEYYGGNNNGR